jgi:hypothetical protein
MRTYDVSSQALTQAMELGLGDSPPELIQLLGDFARRSAIVTHTEGNRRYGGFVLDIDGSRIYGIAKLRRDQAVCFDCYGTGTHHMKDGPEWIEVPCQTCMEGRRCVI